MRDLYKILKVDRKASQAEIKTAYRKLAKKLHPDLNPEDKAIEQRFKEVSLAYAILGNEERRGRYDRGEIDASGQERSFTGGFSGGRRTRAGAGRGGPEASHFEGINPEDLFAEFFGGVRRAAAAKAAKGAKTAAQKGGDLKTTITIGFLEAARGAKKRLRLKDGRILQLTIPAGTEEGQVLRLKGQGKRASGGRPGDALIEVKVEPHRFFTRKGLNVYLELPVTLQEALLGAEIQVPTITGRVSLKVPPGSNTGTTLRLKGKGLAGPKGGPAGDQYVKLKLVLPDQPDRKLRDFVKSWGKAHDYDPRKNAGITEEK
jgi:DnaJ-class molecular chaperone